MLKNETPSATPIYKSVEISTIDHLYCNPRTDESEEMAIEAKEPLTLPVDSEDEGGDNIKNSISNFTKDIPQ